MMLYYYLECSPQLPHLLKLKSIYKKQLILMPKILLKGAYYKLDI